jgi:hypothetical protein
MSIPRRGSPALSRSAGHTPPEALVLNLLLVLFGCNGPDPGTTPEPLDCSDTWETYGAAFVTTWCTSCHSTELVGEIERYGAPEQVNLDSLAGVRLWAPSLSVATGPDPSMPPAGGVPTDQVERFAEWVACGLPGEETSAVASCDEAVPATGDVTVSDQAAADALCAGGPIEVVGALTASGDALLACVCAISGDLTVTGGSVGLPALTEVGGQLVARDGAVAFLAPELKSVGGSAAAEDVPELVTFDLTELETVGQDVIVADAPDLTELLLERLVTVPGDLRIERSGVESTDLARLVSVGGDLVLDALPAMAQLRGNTGALLTIGGELRFEDLPLLVADYGFARLQSVGGDVTVEQVDSTVKFLGFTELVSIGGSLRLVGNDAMTQYDAFDQLATVGGDLVVQDHPNLLAVDRFEELETVGGALHVENNPVLVTISGIADVTEVGSLLVDGLELAPNFPDFSSLTAVHGDLRVSNIAGVASVALPDALQVVEGSVVLEDLPDTSSLTFNGVLLSGIGGDLVVRRTGFVALDLPVSLETVSGDLIVQDNLALASVVALHGLEQVGGDLVVTGNSSLGSAAAGVLPSEFSVGGSVLISGNGP